MLCPNHFWNIIECQKLLSSSIWLLSGTLYDYGPRDLLPWICVLQKPCWKDNAILENVTPEFDQLSKTVDKLTNKTKLDSKEQAILAFKAVEFGQILEQIMICCMLFSKWFNKPIINLPERCHQDIDCPLNVADLDCLQKREKAEQEAMVEKYKQSLEVVWTFSYTMQQNRQANLDCRCLILRTVPTQPHSHHLPQTCWS